MAKDLSVKIAVCPSAWWWHVFQHRGYSEHTARSLMECFKMYAAYVADQSTFDETTGTITTQFANDDDFLDRMDNKLASDDNEYMLDDPPDGGTPHAKSTIEISDTAKASLASALDNPDMDLAANSHASAKSRRTNFSLSTGNSTNGSVNTKQYAITLQRKLERQHSWNTRTGKCVAAFKNSKLSVPAVPINAPCLLLPSKAHQNHPWRNPHILWMLDRRPPSR